MKLDLELLSASTAAMIFHCDQYDKSNSLRPSLVKHKNTIQLMLDETPTEEWVSVVKEVLEECKEYMESRADADHNGEGFMPNTEMRLSAEITLVTQMMPLPSAPGIKYEKGDGKPKVVCLCGSTRFATWFMIKRWELEKQGIITLGINILPDNYFAEGNSHGAEQEGVKHILDELHKRKIDLSDEVFVLNVEGYIGESTRSEIDYAIAHDKPVKYLEQLKQSKP